MRIKTSTKIEPHNNIELDDRFKLNRAPSMEILSIHLSNLRVSGISNEMIADFICRLQPTLLQAIFKQIQKQKQK